MLAFRDRNALIKYWWWITAINNRVSVTRSAKAGLYCNFEYYRWYHKQAASAEANQQGTAESESQLTDAKAPDTRSQISDLLHTRAQLIT